MQWLLNKSIFPQMGIFLLKTGSNYQKEVKEIADQSCDHKMLQMTVKVS